MSDELLQFIIVVGLGAVCFGCGYLIAFILTCHKYRDEMIKPVSGATISRPANGNREIHLRNRRCGKCNDPKRGGSRRISPSCRLRPQSEPVSASPSSSSSI
jgi:hypothetical protein